MPTHDNVHLMCYTWILKVHVRTKTHFITYDVFFTGIDCTSFVSPDLFLAGSVHFASFKGKTTQRFTNN